MRIANKSIYDGIIRNLGKVSSDMADAHKVVSTAKKINNLSDDPVGLVTVLDLRSSLENINQMERNISMGRAWLTASESALRQTEDILSQTKELTVQMSSATTTSEGRANTVNMVDGLLRQILSLANSKAGNRYIFGGTNTDTIPFAFNVGETQVNYSGNDTPFSIQIGRDGNIAVGSDGKDIFGANWDDDNIFKTLIDLKTYLQSDDIPNINGAMDNLDAHLKNIRAIVSGIAGRTIRLDVKEKIIQDLDITYTERKSEIEDADIAEAIMKLNSKELAYQSALASSSKVMALSLVDYI